MLRVYPVMPTPQQRSGMSQQAPKKKTEGNPSVSFREVLQKAMK